MQPDKSSPQWHVEGFEEAFERWIAVDDPVHEFRMTVLNWMFARRDDPYKGMQRELALPNMWYGHVPGTHHGDGRVVVCSMLINESARTVRCDQIASLSLPI